MGCAASKEDEQQRKPKKAKKATSRRVSVVNPLGSFHDFGPIPRVNSRREAVAPSPDASTESVRSWLANTQPPADLPRTASLASTRSDGSPTARSAAAKLPPSAGMCVTLQQDQLNRKRHKH